MNMQMLNAVGPGIQTGQANAAQLADVIQQHAIRQKVLEDQARAQKAAAWMGGGGLAAGLAALAQSVPGGASPAAMPGPLPPPVATPQDGGIGAAPPPPPAPPTVVAGDKGYGEPTIDKLTRLMIGEAGGEDDRGQMGVAAVVRNRAQQSGLGIDDVIDAPSQFEPRGNAKRWAELQGIAPDNPAYIRARANALRILQGEAEDPTGGADHFYSPTGQQFLGRPKPAWDNGTGVDMGRHRFFKLGYDGKGVPRSAATDAAATTPEADAAATGGPVVGQPGEADAGREYTPMDSLRMTMQLADFISGRYKEVTGEDIAPDLLMDQVERVAKLSNQFTGAQRLAVQNGLGVLRAQTAEDVQASRSATSRANTTDRVNQSNTNNVRTTQTSAANTGARVAVSAANNERTNATSSANNANTNNTRRDLAANLDKTKRDLAAAKEKLTRDTAAGRNTTMANDAVVAAQARVDAANIQMGNEAGAAPAPQYLDERGRPVGGAPAPAAAPKPAARADPLKPQAWTAPTGLPSPKGVPEGTKAKDGTKVVAILKGGAWAKP